MRLKICPACGEKNSPSSVECASCGYDLMSVPAVDPEEMAAAKEAEKTKKTEQTAAENYPQTLTSEHRSANAAVSTAAGTGLVRICPACGALNPPQARKCQKCHEEISDILPAPLPQAEMVPKHYRLEQIGSDYIYTVPCGTIIIGREHEMREALASKPYVSRIHAKLTSAEGKLCIENLSTTNYTYVNNERIPEGQVELHPGDEIGLGGIAVGGSRQQQAAYFVVGIMP